MRVAIDAAPMRPFCISLLASCLLFSSRVSATAGFPYSDETLHYTINWPSGLSVGEAHLQARKGADRWNFEFTLEASVPGFVVSDRYASETGGRLCSLEYEKNTLHGPRRTREKITFDYKKGMARRATAGGGKSDVPISSCGHDALTFLYFVRRELGQGRVPPPETVLSGSSYHVRLEYTGPQTLAVNEVPTQADRLVIFVKGPTSEVSFEAFFARDSARTPVLIRAPFALGTFSMELVR